MAAADHDRHLFGTDGIRGVANAEPMTCETALRLGRAVTHLGAQAGAHPVQVVVGKDTRLSGDMLESALAAGICSMGGNALLAGTLPTPAVAHLTRALAASAGVVVSASHNPFQDNGLKVFARTGFKLADEKEQEIERLLLEDVPSRPDPGAIGRVRCLDDAAARYIQFLRGLLPRPLALKGFKVVIDCAHGATYRVGPELFAQLGADVVAIGVQPDGKNINDAAGATAPRSLQAAVRAEHAHVGIALDGDGDRAILVDEHGEIVDGDELLAMTATDMLARGALRQATVVATVMSNLGLEVALRARGVRLVRTRVGDRYVVEEMVRHGFNLGGEQSGHLIFLDHSTTGDGLVAGLAVARLMAERQQALSELKRVMTKFPQTLLSVPVKHRDNLESLAPLRQVIGEVQARLNDRGRVLVRYSGTEPLVRVMVEGEDSEVVRTSAEEIAAVVRAELAS